MFRNPSARVSGMTESEAIFWSKVKVGAPDECWLWTGTRWGGRAGNRYGYYHDGLTSHYAHRYAYSTRHGRFRPGAIIMHTCDTRLCCNPDHLRAGTVAENVADMVAKGRCIRARGEAHGLAKLTPEKALAIFNDQRIYQDIAAAYGVGLTCVGNIKRGETWSHVTGKKRDAA